MNAAATSGAYWNWNRPPKGISNARPAAAASMAAVGEEVRPWSRPGP
jgi:hypothetical protein